MDCYGDENFDRLQEWDRIGSLLRQKEKRAHEQRLKDCGLFKEETKMNPLKIKVKKLHPNALKEKMKNNPLSTQVGGNHYTKMAIQPVEYIMKNGIGFCEGSVIKYVSRWKEKGGVEDLKKARHFLDMLIEHEEGETCQEAKNNQVDAFVQEHGVENDY